MIRDTREPKYKEVDKIQANTASYIHKKYSLEAHGTGCGMFGGILDKIGLAFAYYGEISEEYAEQILLDAGDHLIEQVNSSEILRDHLKRYPFTREHVNVRLHVHNEKGYMQTYPLPFSYSLNKGEIWQYTSYKNNEKPPIVKSKPCPNK